MKNFSENPQMDAWLALLATNSGQYGRYVFSRLMLATDSLGRGDWLHSQPQAYQRRVYLAMLALKAELGAYEA